MGSPMATHAEVAAKRTDPSWVRDAHAAHQLTKGDRLTRKAYQPTFATSPVKMFYAADGGLEILSQQAFAYLPGSL